MLVGGEHLLLSGEWGEEVLRLEVDLLDEERLVISLHLVVDNDLRFGAGILLEASLAL